jgi:Ca2+-binding EF-hand superfamily protein
MLYNTISLHHISLHHNVTLSFPPTDYRIPNPPVVTSILDSFNVPANTELDKKMTEDIFFEIQRLRMKGQNSNGWKKWAHIEAEAAFLLMDKDESKSISREEFVIFACHHPYIFGPLTQLEKLFTSYDIDHSGHIGYDDLYTLLLEVQMEVSTEEPNVGALNQKVTDMMFVYDKRRDHKLDFMEFCDLCYRHPEILMCASFMHEIFSEADTNSDNLIDKSELKVLLFKLIDLNGLPVLSNGELNKLVEGIFERFDEDKDNYIDYSEFTKYCLSSSEDLSATNPSFIQLILGPTTSESFGDNSVFRELCKDKNEALGLTDAINPTSVPCATCGAPLIGKMGIERSVLSYLSCFSLPSLPSLTTLYPVSISPPLIHFSLSFYLSCLCLTSVLPLFLLSKVWQSLL